jgi:hypothetical protein
VVVAGKAPSECGVVVSPRDLGSRRSQVRILPFRPITLSSNGRTPPSQGGNRGSVPRRVTKYMLWSSNGLGDWTFNPGNARSTRVHSTNTCAFRSTDRTSAFEADNTGSIPVGCANTRFRSVNGMHA